MNENWVASVESLRSAELEARLQQTWNEMSQDIQNLYASMPDCIASCIGGRGGSTGNDGDDFLKYIAARDETCCHGFQPEGKSVSMNWKHLDSSRLEKLKAQQSAGKVI
ncbi:hypothetical protein TNCV_2237491 [Trichonephila clavipes]|nr:hypothetical protein TNCV_2237491 [Trichonephila clavipes]